MTNLFKTRLFLILSIAALLSGCELGNFHAGKLKIGETRLGMAGSKEPDQMAFSYGTFTGFESGSVAAEAGQSLALVYQVTINKGSLAIEVQDPGNEVIWDKTFEADETGSIEIQLEQSGSYAIIVQAKNAGGSFELSWDLE